jgi:hypothetical protein
MLNCAKQILNTLVVIILALYDVLQPQDEFKDDSQRPISFSSHVANLYGNFTQGTCQHSMLTIIVHFKIKFLRKLAPDKDLESRFSQRFAVRLGGPASARHTRTDKWSQHSRSSSVDARCGRLSGASMERSLTCSRGPARGRARPAPAPRTEQGDRRTEQDACRTRPRRTHLQMVIRHRPPIRPIATG